ncbi:MAG: tail fiber protein [Acidobacteria bacterium]|nr:tail fiber protein [Acidobacteriota bacterium]
MYNPPAFKPRRRISPRFLAFAAALLLGFLVASPGALAQRDGEPTSETAWDALVSLGPERSLEAVSPEERRALNTLSPEEAQGLLEEGHRAVALTSAPGFETLSGAGVRGREMIYVPVEPCALADTRLAGGAFVDDEIRFFVVRGETTDYSPQGGSSTGCGIPGLSEAIALSNTARAVLLHFEILGATREGKLTAWASNEPQPLLTHLSYPRAPFSPGPPPTLGTSGVAIVPLCDAVGVDPCPFGDVRLRLSGGGHVAVSVHGYFLADQGVPAGLISMWSGALADIPTGWVLCDGTNGTPDLRDRFILGTDAAEEPGAAGGAHGYSLSEDQLAPHGHDLSIDSNGHHAHSYLRPLLSAAITPLPGLGLIPWNIGESQGLQTTAAGEHSHTGTALSSGLGAPIDNRPAFYKLAFILKK